MKYFLIALLLGIFSLLALNFENQQSNQRTYYCTTDADCESYWGY